MDDDIHAKNNYDLSGGKGQVAQGLEERQTKTALSTLLERRWAGQCAYKPDNQHDLGTASQTLVVLVKK